MRTRLSLLFSLLLASLALALPVLATDTIAADTLTEYGMTESEAEAFAALAQSIQGEITEQEIGELLTEYVGDATDQTLPGQQVDGVYTDPAGYSITAPVGWTLQETTIGPTVVITGPVGETGFMPTITVVAVEEVANAFLTKTQEEIDALLGESLPNYLPVALDDFDFLDIPAREMVCMYGADEETMLMQYQLHFNNQGKTFIITMTTLAEEAAHEEALDMYDTFLADFTLLTGQGIG